VWYCCVESVVANCEKLNWSASTWTLPMKTSQMPALTCHLSR
jgi:hypothetical protein